MKSCSTAHRAARRVTPVAALLLGGCAGFAHLAHAPAPETRALRSAIDSMVSDTQFHNMNWGILIVNPKTGDTLYQRNAHRLFMPASNEKIITSSVAWTQLGPDYRYRTTFVARGPVRDSVLDGDLVVIGRGDPTLSDHMLKDAMIPMRAIADSLAAHGIARIRGRVVAGGDALSGPNLGFGWEWDDLDYPYSAGVDELFFNEGFTDVHAQGGAHPGDPVTVTTSPAHTFPPLHVTATTIAPGATLLGGAGTNAAPPDGTAGAADTAATRLTIVNDSAADLGLNVGGTVLAGDTTTIGFAFRNQRAAYLAALGEALHDRGIAVGDSATDSTAAADTLFVTLSPPLREILPALLKPSQNQIAEILYRTVALEKTGVGSPDSARRFVERQLVSWGIPKNEFAVRDGSGLSRHDYVAPATLVHIYELLMRDTAFTAYYDALPIAGVDGTIANRMKGTPAQGNVHAKTGTVDKARSLSGYVTTADGQMLIFSFLANNFTTPNRAIERVQDAICERLAAMRLASP